MVWLKPLRMEGTGESRGVSEGGAGEGDRPGVRDTSVTTDTPGQGRREPGHCPGG